MGLGSARALNRVRVRAQELGESYLATVLSPPQRADLMGRDRVRVSLRVCVQGGTECVG